MEHLYDLNIERALLSAVLFEPLLLDEMAVRVTLEMFYLPFHQQAYSVMIELSREEKPIDEEFMRAKLRKRAKFDEAAMVDILSANPITHIDAYVDRLAEQAKKRMLVTTGTMIKKRVIEDDASPIDVAGEVDRDIQAMMELGDGGSRKDVGAFVGQLYEEMVAAAETGEIPGYQTGISALDRKIGAAQPGELWVIAARPSMGKTALVTTITNNVLNFGHGVLINSLEMSGSKIMARLVATRSGEPLWNIKKGLVSNKDGVDAAMRYFPKSDLHIDDDTYLTISEIKSRAALKFRKNPNIKWWFVDHLRYIKKPGDNIANEISEITKELRRVGKRYGVVVVLLSQLNRANEQRVNKRAMLSDLRESGAVEEDADVIIFPHRESYYQRNINEREPDVAEAELNIGKNRDGPAGVCKCYFHAKTTSFSDTGVEVVYEDDSLGHGVEMPVIG